MTTDRTPLDAPAPRRARGPSRPPKVAGSNRVMTSQKLPPDLVEAVRRHVALDVAEGLAVNWTTVVEQGLRDYVHRSTRRRRRAAGRTAPTTEGATT